MTNASTLSEKKPPLEGPDPKFFWITALVSSVGFWGTCEAAEQIDRETFGLEFKSDIKNFKVKSCYSVSKFTNVQ